MYKPTRLLAILTACAALTGMLAAPVSALETTTQEKTVAYLIDKYYYHDKMYWTMKDSESPQGARYNFLTNPDNCRPAWVDDDGNISTEEAVGGAPSAAWYNENVYVDFSNGGTLVYVDCEKSGAFYYKIKEDGTVVVLGRDDAMIAAANSNTLVIPTEIEGCTVTEIGSHAFSSLSYPTPLIEKIVVPDTVTVIEDGAFASAVSYKATGTEINLPASIQYIGAMAFNNVGVALGPVLEFPESLEVIYNNTFLSYTYIAAIKFPKSVFLASQNSLLCNGDGGTFAEICDKFGLTEADLQPYVDDPAYTLPCYDEMMYGGFEDGDFYALPDTAVSWITFDEALAGTIFDGCNTFYCPESAVFLPGDVNHDQIVNIADLTLLARYAASDAAVSLTAHGKRNSDVNTDGQVDALDLTLISRKLAQLD